MLPWLDHDDALLRRTEAALGVHDWRQALHDPRWAARNRHVQILLTGVGLSAWAQIAPHLPAPGAVAGYSVGELAAFCAAGVFDAGTAVDLAALRAEAMDRCAAVSPGGLLAVGGLEASAVEALCIGTGVSVAIRIEVDAVVLGGPQEGLDLVEAQAVGRGARCSRLNVELASHTPAMRGAADEFAHVLRGTTLKTPAVALFSNATGDRVFDADQAAQGLSSQIAQTVQWADCLAAVHARRVACVLEIGPGSALAAMWNRRYPEVPARSVDEFRGAGAVVEWVKGKLAGAR
jgi:[acyl-carrier-protein] S-malonyltransferase